MRKVSKLIMVANVNNLSVITINFQSIPATFKVFQLKEQIYCVSLMSTTLTLFLQPKPGSCPQQFHLRGTWEYGLPQFKICKSLFKGSSWSHAGSWQSLRYIYNC